ncbi:MAG: hypothetical protein ABR573_06845 [Candidatus Dormibacteria bacterium]
MNGPVESVQQTVRSMRPSTRARILAVFAVVTPAGLVVVNIAAYVMSNLAAFRLAITISAVVSTLLLNAITGMAAFRGLQTRMSQSPALGWMFQEKYVRSNAVCFAFLLLLATTVSGELTYQGLSDPRKLPNLSTFLAGLLGLAVPLVLAALFRDEVGNRARRRYRTRG